MERRMLLGIRERAERTALGTASIPAMPLAISTLYFLPFIVLGVLLVAMLVLYLLARIQNGRFLRPLITQLSKIAFMRRWFQKMSVSAYERSNPDSQERSRRCRRSERSRRRSKRSVRSR